MTRTHPNWRERAIDTVNDRTAYVTGQADELATKAEQAMSHLHDQLLVDADEYDRSEARNDTRAAEELLREHAHRWFDLARAIRNLRAGPTLRQLAAKKPVGYSNDDCGVAHNAYYGERKQRAAFERQIVWPLKLSEWDKQTVDHENPSAPPLRPDVELVSAEGTTKYTTKVGGRTVHVVVNDRDHTPV